MKINCQTMLEQEIYIHTGYWKDEVSCQVGKYFDNSSSHIF